MINNVLAPLAAKTLAILNKVHEYTGTVDSTYLQKHCIVKIYSLWMHVNRQDPKKASWKSIMEKK